MFRSDCANAQTDMNLCLAHMLNGTFSWSCDLYSRCLVPLHWCFVPSSHTFLGTFTWRVLYRVYLFVLIDHGEIIHSGLRPARKKKNEWAKRTSFESLRTRLNYFSVIDQNNQINCLLHFHSCFTFEFSHSAVMISCQNSSSQCMNFRRRGLVWKSVAILFSH